MDTNEQWFAYLSGEHMFLPKAEVSAILESEGKDYVKMQESRRLLRIKTTMSGGDSIAKRAAYVKYFCKELFICEASIRNIAKASQNIDFQEYLSKKNTFRTLVIRIDKQNQQISKQIEVDLGRRIIESVQGVKVRLDGADITFLGILVGETFLLGIELKAVRKKFSLRRPSVRPFFHPSAMLPKISRCMVNLARAVPGKTLLDPFCGTGSMLIEAGLIGCNSVGLDINKNMIQGARQNLKYFGNRDNNLLVADASRIPIRNFDCVATDPPYGRGASTHGRRARELVQKFLNEILKMPIMGHLCLAFPQTEDLLELGVELGYRIVESFQVREHKSLTREIVVFKKA